jgi:YidC/Oxa1 family membrane protein insertase
MTNNIRVFLWIALALALWMNYEAWNRDYGAQPASATQAQSSSQGTGAQSGLETAIPQASQAPTPQTAQGSLPAATGSTAPAATVPANGEPSGESAGTVRVRTDVLDLRISLQGGTLVEADLLRYPRVKGEEEPVRLLNRDNQMTLYARRLFRVRLLPQCIPMPSICASSTKAASAKWPGG